MIARRLFGEEERKDDAIVCGVRVVNDRRENDRLF